MRDRTLLVPSFAAAVLLAFAAAACTKTEEQSSGEPTTKSTPTAETPSANARATSAASAAPAAADTTAGTPGGADATGTNAGTGAGAVGDAGSAAKHDGVVIGATGGAGALAAANEACGKKPLPDCPLQAWMKANTNPAVAANDLPTLQVALEKSASFAPSGYANWASIAKDGAKAAKAGNMTAAKAACRTCHDQYKAKYKAELRGRTL